MKGPSASLKTTQVADLPNGISEPVAWEGECLAVKYTGSRGPDPEDYRGDSMPKVRRGMV